MIKMNKISVHYDNSIKALDNISLELPDNKTIIVIGKNGSGKSTLLGSIVGIVDSVGVIDVNGVIVNDNNLVDIRNKVGLLFQNPDHQLFMNRVYDDLAFGVINQGKSKDEVDDLVQEIACKLNITDLLERSSNKLSGGQKRMVAIASVLIMKPEIILMDEPSSFLDPISRRKVINVINDLDQTVVIASHDLDMALDVGQEIVLLNDGKVIEVGEPITLLSNKELLESNGLELPFRYQG